MAMSICDTHMYVCCVDVEKLCIPVCSSPG